MFSDSAGPQEHRGYLAGGCVGGLGAEGLRKVPRVSEARMQNVVRVHM